MVRSAIFSWALVLLLAGLGGYALRFPIFAEVTIDLAIGAFMAGVLVHVIRSAVDLLTQGRRSAQ
jgi:hypothetical protein